MPNILPISDLRNYIGVELAERVSLQTDYKYVICRNHIVLYKTGEEHVEIYQVMNWVVCCKESKWGNAPFGTQLCKAKYSCFTRSQHCRELEQ